MLIHEEPYRSLVIKFLRDEGYSLNKTAEIMGLSQSTVRRVLDPKLAEEHLLSKRRLYAAHKLGLEAADQTEVPF